MREIDDPLAMFGGAAPKRFTQGTHRVTDPDATLQWLCPLLPALGITRVANVTGLDYIGIPVVMVCRPNSRSLSVAQGKGWNLAAAKASGIMEAVEGHHSQHITLPLKYASYDELRFTHDMADVARLPQVRNSKFHPDFCLHWIEGYDLATGTRLWVPYEMVHTNYTLPTTIVSGCFLPSTNGLASGNHMLEAISHGLCEVVESDARALWWSLTPEAKRRTVLDLTTLDDAACLSVVDKFERANMAVSVWNMTSDLGIPCFYCSLTEAPHNRKSQAGRCGGVGCHPARGIALMRALTEAAQSRLTLISGSRDDISPHDYRGTRGPVASILDALTSPLDGGGQDFRRIPSHESVAIDDDVRWELAQLHRAGFSQVVVVDLTKAEFEIPVVRVVIPGLEGLNAHRQYCPGERAIARIGRQE
ncbi:MAG TPA: YcaO-like family protein [Kiloniellales bacterium]